MTGKGLRTRWHRCMNDNVLHCAMWVKWWNKNRIKTPCGVTLMLRVCDGECLWCPYVNEIHDVHRDIHHHVLYSTLPHRAINHAFGKNRYAGWEVMWLIEYGFCWFYWWYACGSRVKQKQDKTPCGVTLMLRVSDGECLWCPYVNEIHDVHRDIHHHVQYSTLPHRAINWIKTAMQMSGTLVASLC